jgi:hypothetical protein
VTEAILISPSEVALSSSSTEQGWLVAVTAVPRLKKSAVPSADGIAMPVTTAALGDSKPLLLYIQNRQQNIHPVAFEHAPVFLRHSPAR